jgi:hypothetical protein
VLSRLYSSGNTHLSVTFGSVTVEGELSDSHMQQLGQNHIGWSQGVYTVL